jgi:hypothetical protein
MPKSLVRFAWGRIGGTFVFQTEDGSLKVRMFGIDATEKGRLMKLI